MLPWLPPFPVSKSWDESKHPRDDIGRWTAGAAHPLGKDHATVRHGLKKEATAMREGAGDSRGYEKAKPPKEVLDKVEAAVKPVVAEAAKQTTVGLPIADVYDKIKDAIGGMSPHAFHAALFHLWDAGRIRLSGWAKSVDEMPRPEHAMAVGSKHMYYIQPG